jgi:glycosyltransferase involved in cell wall biosynthesis
MSRKDALVSAIIIFFNAEKFILEAIESVFTQTYGNWELLLVDDGSTDGSTAIAREVSQAHPHQVRYLEHENHRNLGMSAARNLGIRSARGDYIAFLDADDAWFPFTLQEQVNVLESQGQAAMVFGPLQYWYSWSGKPEDSQRDTIEELGVAPDSLLKPPHLLSLFLVDKATVPSGILVRRGAIERVGGFEEAFRGEYEDQVFCAKICLHEPVFASGRCWYRYRQHPGSAVSVGHATGQTDAARLFFLEWLSRYLSEQGTRDFSVWWSLRKEYWRFTHPGLFWFSRRARSFFSGLG